MNENMEQRRKVRQINVAREVLEGFGYEVIDPDEKEEGPEAPNGPTKIPVFGLSEEMTEHVIKVLTNLRDGLIGPSKPYIDTVATLNGLIADIRTS